MMERQRDLTLIYSLMQGCYWMIFCAVVGFATVYLVAEGLFATDIGILIAVSNIIGALLQPLAAELSERTERITLSQLVMLLSLTGAAGSMALIFSEGVWVYLIYGSLMALLHVIMPLMNALGMAYNNPRQRCNFGFARAMGSLGFAVLSAGLGSAVDRFGAWTIPASSGVLLLLLASIMVLAEEPALERVVAASPSGGPRIPLRSLSTMYPGFIAVLLGVFLIYGFYNITNIYLIQIMEAVGGSAREMGITIAVAAVMELPAMIFFSKLHARLGTDLILKFAAFFWVVKSLGYLLAGRVGHIYATQLFQALSFAPFTPAMVYFADETMAQEDKVKGQAFMATANTLGGVLGSLVGGYFLQRRGVNVMILVSVGLATAGALAIFRGVSTDNRRPGDKKVWAG